QGQALCPSTGYPPVCYVLQHRYLQKSWTAWAGWRSEADPGSDGTHRRAQAGEAGHEKLGTGKYWPVASLLWPLWPAWWEDPVSRCERNSAGQFQGGTGSVIYGRPDTEEQGCLPLHRLCPAIALFASQKIGFLWNGEW